MAGISGIRSLEDVIALKEMLGKNFILISVSVTDPELRYRRMVARGEARDPQSYRQFKEQDEAEERLFRVGEAARLADHSLANDGTLKDLHNAIDRLVKASLLG